MFILPRFLFTINKLANTKLSLHERELYYCTFLLDFCFLTLFLSIFLQYNPTFLGNRVHQHPACDGRDGDGQLEADGRLPPAPHRRGVQGPRLPADTAHGPTQEKGKIRYKFMNEVIYLVLSCQVDTMSLKGKWVWWKVQRMQFGKPDNILVASSESVEFEIISAHLTV